MSDKKCAKCHIVKQIIEFAPRYDYPNKTHSYCNSCRASIIRLKRNTISSYIEEYKTNKPCADCGGFFIPYCMDFDHLQDKKFNISNFGHTSKSLEKVKEEISKCELVCANCHRIRTKARMSSDKTTGKLEESL